MGRSTSPPPPARSRPTRSPCTAAGGVRYYAFALAYDGVTIVVHPSNGFVECLTVDQLRLLWQPDDPATTWRDLDPAWPDDDIELYGPGESSGTFDFFTATIVGESGLSRLDYFPSEDDNVLVAAVADDEDGLGYFGYAYYQDEAHRDDLKAVAIDAGQGCVLPTPETIASGAYQPLSRPLFLYVRAESLASSIVLELMRFTLASARDVVPLVGYVPVARRRIHRAAGQARSGDGRERSAGRTVEGTQVHKLAAEAIGTFALDLALAVEPRRPVAQFK